MSVRQSQITEQKPSQGTSTQPRSIREGGLLCTSVASTQPRATWYVRCVLTAIEPVLHTSVHLVFHQSQRVMYRTSRMLEGRTHPEPARTNCKPLAGLHHKGALLEKPSQALPSQSPAGCRRCSGVRFRQYIQYGPHGTHTVRSGRRVRVVLQTNACEQGDGIPMASIRPLMVLPAPVAQSTKRAHQGAITYNKRAATNVVTYACAPDRCTLCTRLQTRRRPCCLYVEPHA